MNSLIIIDMLIGLIGIGLLIWHEVTREEYSDDESGECHKESEKIKGSEYPEITISGGCRINRKTIDGIRVYRDIHGALHRQLPREILEVELDDPVKCSEDVCRVTITSVSPGIKFLGYITSDRKKIIEY